MTTQELIEKLKELPQNMEIVVLSDRRDYRFYAVEGIGEIELQSDSGSITKVACLSQMPDNSRWEPIYNGKVANYWKHEIVWGLCDYLHITCNDERMELVPIPDIVKLMTDAVRGAMT